MRARENSTHSYIAQIIIFFCRIARHARGVVLRPLPRKGLALLEEQEEEAQSSDIRSTEEWKQYVATYGQPYTERYFASYYHSQVNICPHSSFGWPRCVICIFYMLGQNVCAVCCISLSFKMLPVYGAAATFDYLKQNGLPTDHLQ